MIRSSIHGINRHDGRAIASYAKLALLKLPLPCRLISRPGPLFDLVLIFISALPFLLVSCLVGSCCVLSFLSLLIVSCRVGCLRNYLEVQHLNIHHTIRCSNSRPATSRSMFSAVSSYHVPSTSSST
jgi:hypothetical protein